MTNEIKVIMVEAGNLEVKIVDEFDHSLENMQKFVGGYIEAVRVNDSITLWLNEEGKMIGLPANFYFTTEDTETILDIAVGNVLITGTDSEGETVSLTEEEIKEVQERFLSRIHFNLK